MLWFYFYFRPFMYSFFPRIVVLHFHPCLTFWSHWLTNTMEAILSVFQFCRALIVIEEVPVTCIFRGSGGCPLWFCISYEIATEAAASVEGSLRYFIASHTTSSIALRSLWWASQVSSKRSSNTSTQFPGRRLPQRGDRRKSLWEDRGKFARLSLCGDCQLRR